MDAQVGVPAGTLSAASPSISALTAGPKNRLSRPITVTPYLWAGGCNWEYTECVQQCLLTRYDFQTASGDFWRADHDFWDNTLHGNWYLNTIRGGPQEKMSLALYQMNQQANRFRSLDCNRYL
jgi:hypothetical protein